MNWFMQQSRRDQIALMILAVALLIVMVWLLAVQPMSKAAQNSQRRLQTSMASLARVKSLAADLQYYSNKQPGRTATSNISIVGVIDKSSRAVGLSFSSVSPSANGDEATVRFDNAELSAMLQWLYDLENVQQATVQDLRLNASNQSGYVSGSIRIKK